MAWWALGVARLRMPPTATAPPTAEAGPPKATPQDRVLREAFRVLKPGGRFAVSDVVIEGEMPAALRKDMEAYVGCVAGALESSDYLAKLTRAGFVNASIEPTRRYRFDDLDATTCGAEAVAALSAEERERLDGRILSGFIRASKPERLQG